VASFKWGGTYRLVNKATGRCVDIAGPSTADGANLQQWTSFGGNNQQFKPVSLGGGWYRFEARHSGKVLDVANCWSSGDGARLQQWTWANNDCQQFRLEPM
jgi:glucosylceramidase